VHHIHCAICSKMVVHNHKLVSAHVVMRVKHRLWIWGSSVDMLWGLGKRGQSMSPCIPRRLGDGQSMSPCNPRRLAVTLGAVIGVHIWHGRGRRLQRLGVRIRIGIWHEGQIFCPQKLHSTLNLNLFEPLTSNN
jgi:hypothetical protein